MVERKSLTRRRPSITGARQGRESTNEFVDSLRARIVCSTRNRDGETERTR